METKIKNKIKRNPYYKFIKTEKTYNLGLNSGMFWVHAPELSGDWSKDKLVINNKQ